MTEFEPSSPPAPEAPQPPPPQHVTVLTERRPRRGSAIFWGFLGGCITLFVLITIVAAAVSYWGSDDTVATWQAGAKIAVIPIDGEILESREFIDALHRYRDQSGIRAIVVRINSPGGAVVPSQEIFEEIRKVRKDSGKPVVASMDSVAASGGYYIAVGCDRIVANPGTITGSIGVIAQWFNVQGLLQWARLKPETLISGPMKDAGSPYRDLSPEERAYLQSIVTQLHQQFVTAVAEGRTGKLSKADVERLADGRVYTGEEAHRLKLVDDLGNLQDAVQIAANLAGIRGTPRVLYPRPKRPGLIELFSDSEAEKILQRISSGAYNFLYRWY
jgi:protease IV